jgi:hypothetical protein
VLDSIAYGTGIFGACIVVIKLICGQRRVLASFNFVASINGTWVMVITVHWGVDAFFLISRASVDGANVVVVAIFCSNIGEDASSCRVARFVSARVLVIANDCIVVDSSSNCITPVSGTFVVVINIHWGVYAFSRGLAANISCAWVMVITNNRGFDDSGVAIASYMNAKVAVVKRNCNVLASEFDVARIGGASVFVVTVDCNVLASEFLVARIKSADIAVVTVDCIVLASLMFIASISCACVLVIANYSGVRASGCWVTVVVGTCIEVIAINWNVANNSSDNRALFSCAFVVVAKFLWFKDASFGLVASIISARVVIVTYFSSENASFNSVTFFGGASIVIRANNSGVLASKSWAASINGTCIVVITVFLFRVIANSIFAFVDGAKIFISTFNSSVDALVGLCIASINSARITVITTVETRVHILDLSSCRIALVVDLGFASSSWNLETSDSHIFQAESITSASCGFSSAISRDEFSNVLASFGSITIVDSAFVSIFTVHRSINDSFVCIARSNSAAIRILDAYRSVNAVSGFSIADFGCAFIVIIASFLGVNAVSIDTSINSAFVSITAVHWGVLASSVGIAGIFGTWVVVVTDDCDVLASNSFVARIGSA